MEKKPFLIDKDIRMKEWNNNKSQINPIYDNLHFGPI